MTEKPKMLFVDDRSKRIHYALTEYGKKYDVTIASNVKEALRALVSQKWAVISLDHDLTGSDFEDPDTPTCGMEIVRYLQKMGGWPVELLGDFPVIEIHSSNLFAVHLMTISLQDMGFFVYYVPIIYPKDNMQYDEKGVPK